MPYGTERDGDARTEEDDMPDKTTAKARTKSDVLTEEEKAALQETVKERRRASRRDPAAEREEGERDVLAQIEQMAPADRVMAERIHAMVKATAPELVPRTWYGMPAYARKARSSASSRRPRSTRSATRRSGSTRPPTWRRARCGPVPGS
jgi:hypothetical protein